MRTAVTDSRGRYRFDVIQPGSWKVWAQIPGEATSEERNVTLRLSQTVELDFTVGSVLEESITVTAEKPLIDPRRTGGVFRIDGDQAESLPIAGRSVTDLALLDSAVISSTPGNFFGERGTVFSVNGQSGRSNTFLVDGLDNNDIVSNTTMNSGFSQLTIQEVVVETSNYAAEFSRSSGAVFNIITKRGTNEPTADFFFQGIAPSLSESGEFVSSMPDQSGVDSKAGRYITGASFGGPLATDRAFWFAAYEHMSSDGIASYTGADRNGVEGGWVIAPNRSDNFFLRTDFNLGNSQLMLRLSLDDQQADHLNVTGRTTPEAGFRLDERDFQAATSLTTVISPALFNEIRLLWGTSDFNQQASSERPGVEHPSGIFGGNSLNSQLRDETKLQFIENLTWQIGDHTTKFGVDVVHSITDLSTTFNPNGNFLYDSDIPFEPGDCGDLLASQVDPNDLLAPIPCPGQMGVDDDGDGIIDEPGIIGTYPIAFALIQGAPEAKLRDTRLGLFAQDSWQVTPSFILDYGLRYDISTYRLPRGSSVPSRIDNGGAGTDRDNIAPRAGFAWAPGEEHRFLLRGSAGVFYDKLVLAFPAVSAITSGTEIGLIFPQGLTLEITEDVVEQLGIDTVKQVLLFPQSLTLRFSTGTEMETPYTVQYSLGTDIGIGARGALSATVTRALGYNIPQMQDYNPVVDPQPLTVPVHADPNTGSIAAIETTGRSWYSALDLGWRWRGEGSWYRTGYTWSKTIDTGPDPLKGGIALPAVSGDVNEERGRSDSDRRHQFALSGGTNLPLWGLQLSGIARYATGAPFNVTSGKDDNLDGVSTDRPAGVGRNTGADTNLAQVNALRRKEGLPPVHDLEEPDYLQVDLRAAWPFAMRGGRVPGELFIQIFNIFDRVNGGPIEGSALSRNFGNEIGILSPPRTMELGFRFGFGPVAPGSGSPGMDHTVQ